MSRPKRTLMAVILAALLILTGLVGYHFFRNDPIALVENAVAMIDAGLPAPVFIFLMIVLPVVGIPLSIFLVVAGIKFGLWGGLAVTALLMPLHFLISFALVHLIKPQIERILSRRHYKIPQIPAHKQFRYAFLLAMLPVTPYVIKNYLMPLAGISWRIYFWMNWGCQYLLAVPVVVLGGSMASMNIRLLIVSLVIILALFWLIGRLERKYGGQLRSETVTG